MYRQLLPYLKRFIFVRQGAFNRYYEGKLLSLDNETIQIRSYKKDGTEEELWTIALDTVTEFSIGGRHLAELELKVSYASPDEVGASNRSNVIPLLESTTPQAVEPQVDEL